MRPVLFVTNHVPPDRLGGFVALHERVGIELALFGGRSHHATADADAEPPPVPHRRVTQREVHALAASGRFRAVVAGTVGRTALPAAFLGARRAGVPFVLWSALWGELWTPAHLAARPLMAWIYRGADAVVAYGPHVADFARRHGARRVLIAPQAVDNAFWSAPFVGERPAGTPFTTVFVGRDVPEKGLDVLLDAWRLLAPAPGEARLVLVGEGLERAAGPGIEAVGALAPAELRNLHGGADVLVVASIASRRFREPWGLVVNEAMNRHVTVIATDAVGAAAGGLVVHERTGLVVPAGDPVALAAALGRLRDDPLLREQLAVTGAARVAKYSQEAWADGFAAALGPTDLGRTPC